MITIWWHNEDEQKHQGFCYMLKEDYQAGEPNAYHWYTHGNGSRRSDNI